MTRISTVRVATREELVLQHQSLCSDTHRQQHECWTQECYILTLFLISRFSHFLCYWFVQRKLSALLAPVGRSENYQDLVLTLNSLRPSNHAITSTLIKELKKLIKKQLKKQTKKPQKMESSITVADRSLNICSTYEQRGLGESTCLLPFPDGELFLSCQHQLLGTRSLQWHTAGWRQCYSNSGCDRWPWFSLPWSPRTTCWLLPHAAAAGGGTQFGLSPVTQHRQCSRWEAAGSMIYHVVNTYCV